MLRKILKKIFLSVVILLIIIILILIILFIFERIYSYSEESKWHKDNSIINKMNFDKLSDDITWNGSNLIWLYKDEELSPKGNKKRILIVGDSYVWGDGYSNANYIWWQQLRNKILEDGYNDVEIIATGYSGYSTAKEFQMLLSNNTIEKVNPDLIIFTYVENDVEAWDTPYDDNPIWTYARTDYDKAFEQILPSWLDDFFSQIYPNLYRKTSYLLIDKYSSYDARFGIGFTTIQDYLYSPLFLDNYANYVLAPLKKYLEQDVNIPYFFVAIPYFPSPTITNHYFKLKKKFDSLNIDFIDLNIDYSSELVPFDKFVYNINPVNGHPGTKTTEFSARKVLEYLELNYPDILGEKGEILMDDIIINDPMPRTINLNQIDEYTFDFIYPSKKEKNSFLNMPIEQGYIKLNFMYPVDLKSIEITGDNIKNIDIYINKINPDLGYDDQKMYKIDYFEKYIWNIDCNQVTSINISANIKNGNSSKLKIKFVKE